MDLAGRADITQAGYMALINALGDMELTPTTLMDLAGRADITQAAYMALINALGDMELTPATLMALAGRADISQADYMALANALGSMTLDVATLEMLAGRADITQSDYDALEMALGSMPLTPATLMELAGRAAITRTAYNALVAALGGMALDVATLEKLVETYNKSKETMDEAETTAAQEIAEALRMEIDGVALQDHLDSPAVGIEMADISFMASSTGMVTAEVSRYEAGDAPDAITGFHGVTLTKGRETIVAYSDIEDATATAISAVYTKQAGTGPARYTVATSGTPGAGEIGWGNITADGKEFTDTPGDATATPATNGMTTFPGMVMNVPGTFSCAGSDANSFCTTRPVIDDDGKVAIAVAGWTFTPTNANAMVDVQDADGHLVFGWWLQKNTKGVPTGVDVFAFAPDLTASAAAVSADGIEGTASYSGGAAGKYALHHTGGANSEAGHFTATATLEADFDADSDNNAANGNDENGLILSGMIDNIMTGDVERDWTVTLMGGAAVTNAEAINNLDDTTLRAAEWEINPSLKATGQWDPILYGGTATAYPTAVTGEFEAGIDNLAHIIGAFGATLDE